MNEIESPFLASHRGTRRRWRLNRQVTLASVVLILACLGYNAWAMNQQARHEALRLRGQVSQIRQLALAIQAITPHVLEGDATQIISQVVDGALHESHIPDRALRTRTVNALGPYADTGLIRSQVHLELTGITQEQAARLVGTLEQISQPVNLESADLNAASGATWDLTLELTWLQKPYPVDK